MITPEYVEVGDSELIKTVLLDRETRSKNKNVLWTNKKGQLHRTSGPAMETVFGGEFWYYEGLIHREGNLPAVTWSNGNKNYYCHGVQFFPEKTDARMSWDEYFMGIARAVSMRSEDPKTKVGCVAVKDRRIISTGYNGAARGRDWSDIDKSLFVVHAEVNALIYGDYDKLEGATLYCTHSPCHECVRVITAAGIAEVVYSQVYCPDALARLTSFNIKTTGVV